MVSIFRLMVFMSLFVLEASVMAEPLEKGDIVFWRQNLQSKTGMKRADVVGRYGVTQGQRVNPLILDKNFS